MSATKFLYVKTVSGKVVRLSWEWCRCLRCLKRESGIVEHTTWSVRVWIAADVGWHNLEHRVGSLRQCHFGARERRPSVLTLSNYRSRTN